LLFYDEALDDAPAQFGGKC